MNFREAYRLPNLLSLSRILLAPVAVYFLSRAENWACWVAGGIVVEAGITDGLDGYLARRTSQVTPLGVALDPIADKVFAAILAVGLIFFRHFPIWLAVLVVGRDLLILWGGVHLMRRKPDLVLPSNLTGKWAFASLAVLLAAYIIRFNFSIIFMTPIATVLLIASLVNYVRVFIAVTLNKAVPCFQDKKAYRVTRIILTLGVALAHLVMFWVEFLR
jgi:CDP-diacylglycerol--glycerol-3-phosphate 3-phosphatidyltransferase